MFNLLVLSATVLVSHFSVLPLHYNLYFLIGPPAWQADCGAECRMKEHVLKTKVACSLGSYLGSWLCSEVLGPLKPPGQLWVSLDPRTVPLLYSVPYDCTTTLLLLCCYCTTGVLLLTRTARLHYLCTTTITVPLMYCYCTPTELPYCRCTRIVLKGEPIALYRAMQCRTHQPHTLIKSLPPSPQPAHPL